MTVTNTDNKDIYAGDGATLVFAYTFKIFQDSDLVVTITDTLGVNPLITMVLSSDYTVSGAGTPSGGDVTLLLTGQISSAPLATDTITILRLVPLTQNLDLIENDNFPSQSQEDAFDKLTFIDQQQQETIDRSVTIPASVTGVSVALPVPVADFILGWNSTPDALINVDPNIVGLANAQAAAASAAAALASENAASASETNASASESSASNSVLYAAEWANKAEDSLISAPAGGDLVDDYSALHWANKAAASAASNNLPTIQGGDAGKILEVNPGETGYQLVANVTTLIDDFTIINPTGELEVAPFMLDNIVLNAMRISENNSLTIQQLSDGIEDTYTDEDGIDTVTSLNEDFEGGSYRTTPGTLAENTKLVLNADSAYTGALEIIDSGGNDHIVTQNGNATLKGLHYKFGDGALCLNGVDQELTIPDSNDWDILNANDWTIGLWVKLNDPGSGLEAFVTHRQDASNEWSFYHNSIQTGLANLEFSLLVGGVAQNLLTAVPVFIFDTDWHFVSVNKVSNDWCMYVDGVHEAQSDFGAMTDSTNTGLLRIGSRESTVWFLDGYVDDVHINKGNFFSAAPIAKPKMWFPMVDNKATVAVTDYGSVIAGTMNGTSPNTEDRRAAGKVRNSYDFNGTDNYINIDGHVASIRTDTTGSFCGWFNANVTDAQTIVAFNDANNDQQQVGIDINGNNIRLDCRATAQINFIAQMVGVLSTGTWQHFAFVQDGVEVVGYLNGVASALTFSSDNDRTAWFSLSGGASLDRGRIGARVNASDVTTGFFDGRLEDIRYYQNTVLTATQVLNIRDNGVAGYYGIGSPNYTVPTAAQVADANTVLLLPFDTATQGQDLVDISTLGVGSPHTVTSVAGAGVTGKFGNAYASFDGTGDYLSIPDSADWTFGTGDFTVEAWIRIADFTKENDICGQYADANNWTDFFKQGASSQQLAFACFIGGVDQGNFISSDSTLTANTWNHVAFVRDGSTARIFLNGVALTVTVTTAFGTWSDISAPLRVGDGFADGTNNFHGDIDDLRIVKGTAVYTTGFTPPTVALTAIANTVLLLNCNTQDESPYNNIPTFVTAAAITTAEFKFGTGSYNFNGSTDLMTIPGNNGFNILADNKQDITVDFWARLPNNVGTDCAMQYHQTDSKQWRIEHIVPGGWRFNGSDDSWVGGVSYLTAQGGEIIDANWHHIAVIKVGKEGSLGGQLGVYVDGSQVAFDESDHFSTFVGTLRIGARSSAAVIIDYWDGQMDGIRIAFTNTIFSGAPNIGNSDTITIPTAAPAGQSTTAPDLLLQSIANPVIGNAPDTIQAFFDLEDIDPTVLLNTDILVEVSRDSGTTFTAATLAVAGQQATAGRRLISAEVDVSAQPDPGVDLAEVIYKVESANEVQFRLKGASLIWG